MSNLTLNPHFHQTQFLRIRADSQPLFKNVPYFTVEKNPLQPQAAYVLVYVGSWLEQKVDSPHKSHDLSGAASQHVTAGRCHLPVVVTAAKRQV